MSNAKIAHIPNIWQGEECWIIGGGFSLIEQFNVPYSVYQQIASGELDMKALSFYLTPLHSRKVIGANAAGLLGPWVDVLYFRDCDFYKYYYSKIRYGFEGGLRFSSCTKETLGSEVKILQGGNTRGISTKASQVNWNYDTGGAAINLAFHLGAQRIILLGYDMKPGPNGETRWHGPHTRPTGQKQPGQPFKRFLEAYNQIAADAKKLGIEVINANPNSALEAFPKVPVEDLL